MDKVKAAVMLPCDREQRKMFEEAADGRCEFLYVDKNMTREERLPLLSQAEIIFGEPGIREIQKCPRLRWIQMSWAGTDIYTMREGFPQGVILTNASGSFRAIIGEYIVAALLAFCRNLKQYALRQKEELWSPCVSETLLYGKNVLILGAGDIGTGAAERLKAFGTHITGMSRTRHGYPDCYDGMITMSGLDAALPEADIVIGCLPGTALTKGLLNEERLRRMKKDAILLNVGRGSLIDTDALVKVLQEGHLKGAILDVVSPEPLPAGHPLWQMENVIITPHIAGLSFGYSKNTEDRVMQICCQNLERYLDGRGLLNVVDFKTGYASGERLKADFIPSISYPDCSRSAENHRYS